MFQCLAELLDIKFEVDKLSSEKQTAKKRSQLYLSQFTLQENLLSRLKAVVQAII